MRDDMARVIVERPRIPAHGSRKGRDRPLEELPAHEGMLHGHSLRGARKEFNENLAPLRRYLDGQVGRPWDKVYAEIAARLRVDSTVQQHVRDHLHDFVAVKPRRIRGFPQGTGNDLWWQPLYVDPVSGLLCRTDQLPEVKARRRLRAQKAPEPVERVSCPGGRELRLIDGIWYAVQMAPLPTPVYQPERVVEQRPLKPHRWRSPVIEIAITERRLVTPAVRDVVTGEMVAAGPPFDDEQHWREYRRQRPQRVYAVSKLALSRRELRRHGLVNRTVGG